MSADKIYPIAFLFTGQGSQYHGMGKELYDKEPAFKESFDKCNAWLTQEEKRFPKKLTDLMFGDDPAINDTRYSQVCLFVLEYSLAQVMKARGIVPDICVGHSAGEYVAITVAGALTLEEGLELIVERARVMQVCPQQDGGMWAMRLAEKDIKSQMLFRRSRLALAAVNGPKSIVLSGPKGEAKKLMDKMKAVGKELEVSHAFHSPLMSFAADRLKVLTGKLKFQPLKIPVVANVDATLLDEDKLNTPKHWADHLLGTVRFYESMQLLEKMGARVFVEIGPQPTLTKMGTACVETPEKYQWVALLKKGESEMDTLTAGVKEILEGPQEKEVEKVTEDLASASLEAAPLATN